MSYTLIIIIITALISIAAFNNETLFNKLILWPRRMHSPEEYYRLLTSGFIHADWPHLLFNMITLFCFGEIVENTLAVIGLRILYPVLYLTGIIIASLPSFIKNRNNDYYRSLGASGGVAAILFATIYYSPWDKIRIMFIPIGIPSILFGVLYLVYCVYMGKRQGDNINHGAHFWGSIYGFAFAFVFDPTHTQFIEQLMHPTY